MAGTLLLMGGMAQAAGLGKLTVLSHLSEPLRAEIDVVAVEKGELDTLTAKLASPDAYIQSNLPYPPASLGLHLSVEQHANGTSYLSVSSEQPISDPFVDLLIELNWQGGKILRAYTALLDPPSFAPAPTTAAAPGQEAPMAAAPPPPPPPPVETIMGSEMKNKPAEPAQGAPQATAPAAPAEGGAPQAASATPAAPGAETPGAEAGMPTKPEAAAKPEAAMKPEATAQPKEDTYGPVKHGDTLSKIAKEFKPNDVTLDQMLVLLYRNNKSAFMGNNMNRLKTGKVLTIPDASEASGLSLKEARREVRLQAADFNAYRERLAATAGESAPSPLEGGKTAAGRLSGPVEDLGKTGAGEPKEVLKLSKGEAPGAGGNKATQAKVHSLEEEVAARDKTIQEANERITKLEKTIKDMQGLIDLKTKGMAELQNPPGAAPATPTKPGAMTPHKFEPPSPPMTAPSAPPAAPPVASAKPPAAPPMASTTTPPTGAMPPAPPMPAPGPGTPPGAVPAPGMVGSSMATSATHAVMPGAQGKPKPKPRPKIVTAPPPPASLIDQVLDEPLYLAGGVGLLAVLAFLGFRFFRSRGEGGRDDLAAEKKTSEVSAFAATGTDNNGAMAAAARAAPAQVTEEVDPLAEAEIYLAYGRDGQAEEILKEALQAQPRRPEIHLKLLEIYAKRKDAQSFEPIFRELQTSTGSQGELWAQAARLGYQLDPSNPRYQAGRPSGAEAAAEAASTDKTLDFQVDAFDPAPEIGTLTDIDAGFGRRFATGSASSTSGDHLDLNIDLDDAAQTPGTKTDIDLGRLGVSAEDMGVDVDLDSLGGGASTRAVTNTDIDLGTLSNEETAQPPAMDFDLELPPADEKTESQLAKVDSIDFDVKFDDASAPAKSTDGGLDFDIDSISMETGTAGKPEPVFDLEKSVPPMPELDLSSISLDLGDAPAATGIEAGSGGKDERWYDVQTKFDLAKAYQEMGDKEGAREILQEVIAEGDTEQKVAAQKVLEALT